MKAGVIFTGTGPILVLTSYESFTSPGFIQKLRLKGIKKFIASEVNLELCKETYGQKFDIIQHDVKEDDDLRILDYDGHSVFHAFPFSRMGPAQFIEDRG